MQPVMASKGPDDAVKALKRAFFTTSGKLQHTHAASYLPSDPSFWLIPHYKHWLPEEFKALHKIKKILAEDDHAKHLRSLRTERRMKTLTVGDFYNIIRRT